MKALILSCNTGEGHNAAGRAVKERLELESHEVEMLDVMKLGGESVSRIVGGCYVRIVKSFPHFFGLLYKAGGAISSSRHRSPVYYANALLAKRLKRYLEVNETDIILMPHLYPAETVTYMKRKGMLTQKTLAITTDYTCIPFWEETDCDGYILPHEDLIPEYESRGIPREKLYPLGIPVRAAFTRKREQAVCKSRLKLPADKPMYLVMSGSMGFGKLHLFAYELARKCTQGEHLVIICGSNKKIKRTLRSAFRGNPQVHVVGYSEHVWDYMDACDVVYTKPGGLTSTEALVRNIPIVHTAPIPGCETRNLEFFTSRGISVAAQQIRTQVEQGRMLISDMEIRNGMLHAQRKYAKPDASYNIYRLMLRLCGEAGE